MEESTGWVSVYRAIIDNWTWQEKPWSKGQAWVYLFMMANRKENTFPFGAEEVTVERGQFITSEVKLMNKFGWSKSKVRLFLKQLEITKQISKKTDRKKTVISICNYDSYQKNTTNKEPSRDHQETTERPIKDTNNNDNNDNKKDAHIRWKLQDGTFHKITQLQIMAFTKRYPEIDVKLSLTDGARWSEGQPPGKLKTDYNVGSQISNWLKNDVDKAREKKASESTYGRPEPPVI